MKTGFWGFFLAVWISLTAFLLSMIHGSFDALVVSIMLGMLVANLFEDRKVVSGGVRAARNIFLPLGIALYGAQLNVRNIDVYLLPAIVLVFIISFFMVYFISKVFGIEKKLGILLASGLSVCGASAIAVISSVIEARNEDTSLAVIVAMIFGLIGVVFYPVMGNFLNLTSGQFAFLSGSTLPMLGQVRLTASAFGPDCVDLALKYKLLRMSMLVFLVTITLFLSNVKEGRFYVPWYIAGFVLLAILVNVFDLSGVVRYTVPVGTFCLSTALAAIGLSIDFDSIAELGSKPLLSAGLSWSMMLMIIYMGMGIVNG